MDPRETEEETLDFGGWRGGVLGGVGEVSMR